MWLIASGGALFMTFPTAYAAAFSGLYFGLIIVLWLLVGRGLGLELRHQLDNPLPLFNILNWYALLIGGSASSCWRPTAPAS